MARYDGRYDDDQTRDREGSRYGRDLTGYGSDQDQGRSRNRGSGFFGGGGSDHNRDRDRDTDWRRDRGGDSDWRREQGRDRGWGGSERDRNRYEGRFEDGRSTRSYNPANHPDRHAADRHRAGRHDRGQRRFGSDDDHEGLPTDETSRLIGSNKVEGTAVYGRDGNRLGSIYNFMVDKRSGKVEYAVMSYGGFLGMGTRYYPLPWDILGYDTRLGGYRVDMVDRDLERAPSFDRTSEPEFDPAYGNRIRSWYGLGY